MFRALSTRRRSRWGYEQLGNDEAEALIVPKLRRAKSLPAKILNYSNKLTTTPAAAAVANTPSEAQQLKKASKIHPFFSLFEKRRKKAATANPEFSRYMEYVKEGGIWDIKANTPVIYYK